MLVTAEVTLLSSISFRVELVKLMLLSPVTVKDGWVTFGLPLLGSVGLGITSRDTE